MSGNITETEAVAIQKLRSATSDILLPSHDELFLLRWLRARKMDPGKAEKMLRASLLWRKQNNMDTATEDCVPSEFMKQYLPVGPCGTDKEGSTIWALPVGSFDFKGLTRSVPIAVLLKRLFVSMDEAILQLKQQSKMLGRPVTQIYIISDMEHFDYRQILPAVNVMKNMSKIFSDNYPEILKKSVVINVSSPKLFNMSYNLVKNFIDEATQNKIFFYGKDTWKDAIFQDIDPSQLPKIWGGTFKFENEGENWWQALSLSREIPTSYYMTSSSSTQDVTGLTKVTVNNRGKFCVEVEVAHVGTEIRWNFLTENFDIGFGIDLKTKTGSENIVPNSRTDSHLHPESGAILCSKIGTYEIWFDNTYSITRSKKLYYKIKVSPQELLNVGDTSLPQ